MAKIFVLPSLNSALMESQPENTKQTNKPSDNKKEWEVLRRWPHFPFPLP